MRIDALAPLGTAAVAPDKLAAARPAAASADFGSMLADMARETVGTLRAGETTAIAGLQEKASLQRVVEAVMAAETTLHTALALRDKAVGAWQEISRMQI